MFLIFTTLKTGLVTPATPADYGSLSSENVVIRLFFSRFAAEIL